MNLSAIQSLALIGATYIKRAELPTGQYRVSRHDPECGCEGAEDDCPCLRGAVAPLQEISADECARLPKHKREEVLTRLCAELELCGNGNRGWMYADAETELCSACGGKGAADSCDACDEYGKVRVRPLVTQADYELNTVDSRYQRALRALNATGLESTATEREEAARVLIKYSKVGDYDADARRVLQSAIDVNFFILTPEDREFCRNVEADIAKHESTKRRAMAAIRMRSYR